MKNNILYFVIVFSTFLFPACEREIAIYHAKDNDRLNFYYAKPEPPDSLTVYTFIYLPSEQMTDTIWIEVETSGFVTDYPRPVAFEQVSSGEDAAVASVHYVAFDDPSLKEMYVVPRNTSKTRLPIVLKKTADLAGKEVVLRFKVKENGYFKTGFPGNDFRIIRFSNILTKPFHWDSKAEWYFAGRWGLVKYRFMIDAAAEIGVTVNEDFFKKLVGPPYEYSYSVDIGLTSYWKNFFQTALNAENAVRRARGEDVLREAPGEGEIIGSEVTFN